MRWFRAPGLCYGAPTIVNETNQGGSGRRMTSGGGCVPASPALFRRIAAVTSAGRTLAVLEARKEKMVNELHPLRATNRPRTIFFGILCAVLVIQVFRAAGHYSPIYGGDEYAYLISGYYRTQLDLLWERDHTLQRLVNPLYLLFVQSAAGLFNDASVVLRIGGALLYSILVGFCGCYVRQMAGWLPAIGCVLVLGLLPSSCYSAGVMPEIPYYCATVAAILVAASLFPRRPYLGTGLAGILLAMAFLSKPHALSTIIASFVFFVVILFAGLLIRSYRTFWRGAFGAATFAFSVYTSLILFSLIFMERIYWDPRYPLGEFYAGISSGVTKFGWRLAQEDPALLIRYCVANFTCVLMVAGPFLYMLMLQMLDCYRRGSSWSHAEQRQAVVLGWLLLAIPSTVAMVSIFTFTMGYRSPLEALRLHARYYAFLYIVIITAGLSVPDWNKLLSKPLRLVGALSVNGYAAFFISWISVVTFGMAYNRHFMVWFQDNAELFTLFDIFTSNWSLKPNLTTMNFAALGVLLGAPFLVAFRVRNLALASCLITSVSFAIALRQVTRLQHIHSAVIHFRVETGQLIKALLPQATDDMILIVASAPHRQQLSHVLYGMICACYVRQVNAGELVTKEIVPPSAHYVFSVEDIPLGFSTERIFATPAGTLYKIL
jgi:hypothetical protein